MTLKTLEITVPSPPHYREPSKRLGASSKNFECGAPATSPKNQGKCLVALAFRALRAGSRTAAMGERHGFQEPDRPPFAGIDFDNWLVGNLVRLSAIRLDRCCGSRRGPT